MNRKNALNFLRDNPVFWSRLGFCYDPPMKNESGKPLVFTENLDIYGKYHRAFAKSGIKIHTSILHSGWVGVNEYDYSLTDRVLEEVFKGNPDIYYIPRIKLNVPVDWCYENPEDVFVYYGGPENIQEVKAMVGTLKQDYLGYEAPYGYYMAGDYEDTRPNVGGMIALQSFSSKKWLNDACEALIRLIRRLENGKYAKRILGYHIAYGVSGETVLWGRASNRYGDYGIGNKKAFFNWGLNKYKSIEELRKKWGQPELTENNIVIPSPEERYNKKESIEHFFRKYDSQIISSDFDEFISQINFDAIEYFGKAVRENAPDKLIGTFYGYFIHIDNPQYTGHLALDRLLNSPYIDFFAAPKPYYRCTAGEPGGVMCPSQSVNLKKLWVDEMDNRTFLAKTSNRTFLSKNVEKSWKSSDMAETISVMWRELSKNLSSNSGFWWMDLGGGWYDSEELMNEVSKLTRLNNTIRKEPHKSQSDILVIVDEECIMNMNISTKLREGFMEDFLCELRMSGGLFDLFRLKDFEKLDLSPYKLIIFAYTFKISESQRKYINNLPPDKTLMFNYASGIISDISCSIENTALLTNTSFLCFNDKEYDFTQIKADEKSICKSIVCDNGNIRVGMSLRENGGKNIINMLPYLGSDVIRKIIIKAGCHIYADKKATIYGDNRFVAVFPAESGEIEISLKQKGTYKNVFSDEIFEKTDKIKVNLKKDDVVFLLKE